MGKRLAIKVDGEKEKTATSDYNAVSMTDSGSSETQGAKKQSEEKKPGDIVTHTARNLYKTASWFFIPLFFPPDDIIIDELKISFVHREFFLIEEVRTFLIKDVIDVVLDTNLIFGTLKVSHGEFKEEPQAAEPDPSKPVKEPYMVKFLRIADATRARRIIAGLQIMSIQKEDTSQMTIQEVTAKAEELGKAR